MSLPPRPNPPAGPATPRYELAVYPADFRAPDSAANPVSDAVPCFAWAVLVRRRGRWVPVLRGLAADSRTAIQAAASRALTALTASPDGTFDSLPDLDARGGL